MLKKSDKFSGVSGPVLTVVMDGVGLAPAGPGNAVSLAGTPVLDMLMSKYPCLRLRAHGEAVGLPSDDDMGNSEVGHNALGSGQVFAQGAKLVSQSIETGMIYQSGTWHAAVDHCTSNHSAMHFIGLFSDGNVHSHINHLKALIVRCKEEGIGRVRIHILLDGRDVGETSALEYILPFEEFLSDLRSENFDVLIASGGGRMKITMDRYEADWGMVELGWKTHVLGQGRTFASASEAVTVLRKETGAIDQDIAPFVITERGKPAGTIEDGDTVIFYNFRGDRAIEISRAFEEKDSFDKFDRVRVPDVFYAGMLSYDGDLHIPSHYLVDPPVIKNTMGEYFAEAGLRQYAVSETQKYGHVTYFWNGNRSGKFSDELEVYEEVGSDSVPFEQRPWMKCAEITDKIISALRSGQYRFLRCNFPNGDMVGHTGNLTATVISVAAVDLMLSRILPVIDEMHGAAIITADHGNADEMYETDKKTGAPKVSKEGKPKAKTSHTLNPVPCILYDNFCSDRYRILPSDTYGLANLAATTAMLLGFEPPEVWEKPVLKFL